MGQWLLHGGSGYSSGGCSITVPRSFSPHGKVLHGPHTDARGFGGEGQLHVQLGRPLLKSMVSNLLLFLSRPLGITARTRLWNEGRCPVSERVSHVGRNSPQCKLVRTPSDPCGHLLFMLGVHSLPPMVRVGSVRASATVKGPPLAAQKRRRVQQHGFRPP